MIQAPQASAGQRANGPFASVRSVIDGPRSWLLVAFTVTFLYGSWTMLTLRDGSPQFFIHVGRSFVQRSQASQIISGFTGYQFDADIGYDGQFNYFIALDPTHAAPYIDYPAYRYTRILYPLLAGVVGGHDPNVVANALIVINLVMIALGIAVLGAWLRRKGVSAWVAAVFGFYPGVFIALQRDTSEIMASSLVIVAIYLYDYGPRWRLVISALFFALAGLSRETMLVFAFVWAVGLWLSGDGALRARIAAISRSLVVFLAVAFGPLLAWKVVLEIWLGSFGLQGVLSPVPFGGLHYLIRHEVEMEQLRTVVVPAFLCLVAAAVAMLAGVRRVEVWALLINAFIYMAFLSPASFDDFTSSARVTVPIALAAVLAAPYLYQRAKLWFWAAGALWLTPMIFWIVLPVESGLESLVVHRL